MTNPYASLPSFEKQQRSSPVFAPYIFSMFAFALVAFTYFSSERRSYHLATLFTHASFLIAPISIFTHTSRMNHIIRGVEYVPSNFVLLSLFVLPLAFATSFIPYFSRNPFNDFYLQSVFFGPYCWMQWLWIVLLGILPLSILFPGLRRIKPLAFAISILAIGGHIHNGYVVWILSHMPGA